MPGYPWGYNYLSLRARHETTALLVASITALFGCSDGDVVADAGMDGETDSGAGLDPHADMVSDAGRDSDVGATFDAGSAPHSGIDFDGGSGATTGTDPDAGADVGAGGDRDAATAADADADAGPEPDAGTASDAGAGADPDAGAGSEPDGGADPDAGCTVSVTCESVGAECGTVEHPCGYTFWCGSCGEYETCGGGGVANQCGCTPTTSCEDLGAECGLLWDGCDDLDCGGCGAGEVCSWATLQCETCTPIECSDFDEKACGSVDDGCGSLIECGGCSYRERCGGTGEANVCGCDPPTLAICGRGVDGIRCAIENGEGTFSGSYLALPRFVDADHWNNLQYYSTLRFPDINGDGFADVCARGADGLYCALGTGTGHFGDGTGQFNDYYKAFDALWDANGWDDPSNYGTIQFADVNRDGADDVCARWDNGWGCAIADGDGFFNGNSNWTLTQLSTGYPNYTETHDAWATIQMPDFDGDGWPDTCSRRSHGGSPQGLACARNSGSGWYDFVLKKAGNPDPYFGMFGTPGLNEADPWVDNAYNWGTIQFPDLNGDRAQDVCGVDQSGGEGIRCALANGAGGFEDYSMWTGFFKPSEGWDGDDNWSTIHFPDVNGDGLADVCGRGNLALRCALSDGTSFGTATVWQDQLGNGGAEGISIDSDPSRWGTLRYQDIDGDGSDDVCARAEQGIVCARSNGVDGMGDIYVATDAFGDADPVTSWSSGQEYWGTIQFVEIIKGNCRSAGAGLPWGTSAKEPRHSP